MGSETEYTMSISEPLDRRIDPDLVSYYAEPNNLWMANGGRLYVDGRVVEYAAPVCNSGNELLLHERIGEKIVSGLTDTVEEEFDPEFADLISEPRLYPAYKRTGYTEIRFDEDDKSSFHRGDLSTGHHETYQTELSREKLGSGPSSRLINAYLATRIIWTGTGLVSENGYELSQKAKAIDFHGTSSTLHGMKRPTKHKGAGLVEVRTGEGNMSDWAIRVKADMTSLVLRLAEHDVVPWHALIKEDFENAAFRSTSRNPLGPIPNDHKRFDAIDIQLMIAEEALSFGEKYGAPQHELDAAREVIAACQDVQSYLAGNGDLAIISDRIDWAAKLDKLRSRGILLGEVSCANMVAVAHDLSWEDVSSQGPARRWYRKYQPGSLTNDFVNRRLKHIPEGRAQTLTDIINHYGMDVRAVDWDTVSIPDDRYVSVDAPYFD